MQGQNKSNSGNAAKAKAFIAEDEKWQAQTMPSATLDAGLRSAVANPDAEVPGEYFRGQWMEPTPGEDERWTDWINIPQDSRLGKKSIPFEEWQKYKHQKRSQQKYVDFLALATATIDVNFDFIHALPSFTKNNILKKKPKTKANVSRNPRKRVPNRTRTKDSHRKKLQTRASETSVFVPCHPSRSHKNKT